MIPIGIIHALTPMLGKTAPRQCRFHPLRFPHMRRHQLGANPRQRPCASSSPSCCASDPDASASIACRIRHLAPVHGVSVNGSLILSGVEKATTSSLILVHGGVPPLPSISSAKTDFSRVCRLLQSIIYTGFEHSSVAKRAHVMRELMPWTCGMHESDDSKGSRRV